MNERVRIYLRTLLRALWTLISILALILFISTFLEHKTFGTWVVGGFGCAFLMIPTALRFIWECTREGYREGSHSYTGNFFTTVYGGIGINIRDRRYSQAIITLIMSFFAFLLIGPILLALKIVFAILELIPLIQTLCEDRTFLFRALKITGIVALALLVLVIIFLIFKSCSA